MKYARLCLRLWQYLPERLLRRCHNIQETAAHAHTFTEKTFSLVYVYVYLRISINHKDIVKWEHFNSMLIFILLEYYMSSMRISVCMHTIHILSLGEDIVRRQQFNSMLILTLTALHSPHWLTRMVEHPIAQLMWPKIYCMAFLEIMQISQFIQIYERGIWAGIISEHQPFT